MGKEFSDDFSACYVKTDIGYTMWSKVISNVFYDKYCGLDKEDWVNSGKFTIKRIYGLGIGTEIGED